ncbi:hypothetical protein Droror1_Dr00016615 [Drosera rotundifolia]
MTPCEKIFINLSYFLGFLRMPSSYQPRENPVRNPVFLSGFLSKSKISWIPWWVFYLIEVWLMGSDLGFGLGFDLMLNCGCCCCYWEDSVSNMPSLWRKSSSSFSKGNRISRFVADLQTPPKRGSSLVNETGFPTSLVDLFIKNRDRIKKQKKKCVSNPQSIDSHSVPASWHCLLMIRSLLGLF